MNISSWGCGLSLLAVLTILIIVSCTAQPTKTATKEAEPSISDIKDKQLAILQKLEQTNSNQFACAYFGNASHIIEMQVGPGTYTIHVGTHDYQATRIEIGNDVLSFDDDHNHHIVVPSLIGVIIERDNQ